MAKELVYSMRMSKKVRAGLEKLASRECRSIASLLDKIIADYLEEQEQFMYATPSVERRRFSRIRTIIPAQTRLFIGDSLAAFPCSILDLSLDGVLIAYPRGSNINAATLGELPKFNLCFELPHSQELLCFDCVVRRVFNVNRDLKVGAAFISRSQEGLEKLDSYLVRHSELINFTEGRREDC
ncbi:MAG: PilZ domain-containing protein [Syntrophobacteraceae bacterium]